MDTERSFEKINRNDLQYLGKLALEDLTSLFKRRVDTGALYSDRLMALCLCQGAAKHFVRPGHGIKNFDVWAFFREHPKRTFPYRRRGKVDFGPSKFGHHPDDSGFTGRRVDVIGRSIPIAHNESTVDAIRNWLQQSNATSAQHLRQRPVIIIFPWASTGEVIWDPCERPEHKCTRKTSQN